MGVTGAGKTTIGSLLAKQMGWEFEDADQFHPPANIEKMSHGIPLDDADRAPWLAAMHDAIVSWLANGENVVLACSALKRSYREELCIDSRVKLIYLKGSLETDFGTRPRAAWAFRESGFSFESIRGSGRAN